MKRKGSRKKNENELREKERDVKGKQGKKQNRASQR